MRRNRRQKSFIKKKSITLILVIALIIVWCTNNGIIVIPGFNFNRSYIQNTKTAKSAADYASYCSLSENDSFNKLGYTQYGQGDLTINIEDQGSLGLCWDFALTKTIETAIQKKYGTVYDFSERYVDYAESQVVKGSDFWRELAGGGSFNLYEDFMNEKGTRAIWDPMYEMIKYEYPYHRDLVNKWWPNYEEELGSARKFLSLRTNEFYKQLGTKFQLGSPIPMTVNTSLENAEDISISFNGVPLTTHRFNGKFYANRSVTLSATPPAGSTIKGWKIIQVSKTGATTNSEVEGSTYSFIMPDCNNLIVSTIIGDQSGIDNMKQDGWTWLRYGDEIIVCDVPSNTRVALYDLKGICLYQTSAAGGTDIRIPAGQGKMYVLKVGNETVKLR